MSGYCFGGGWMFLCAMHFIYAHEILDFSRAETLKKQNFRQKARWWMGEMFKMGWRKKTQYKDKDEKYQVENIEIKTEEVS